MFTRIKQITSELWWAFVGVGLISILFGIFTIIWPNTILNILIYLFSIFIIVVSVVIMAQSLNSMRTEPIWWLFMLMAICGISFGIFILANPTVAKGIIGVLLAIYIFIQSLTSLIVASYAEDSSTKLPMVTVGILGLIMGFAVIFEPVLASQAMIWVVGLYIAVQGVVAEYYALKLRADVKSVAAALSDAIDINDNKPHKRSNKKPSAHRTASTKHAKTTVKKSK